MPDIGNNINRTSSPFSSGIMPSSRIASDAPTRTSVDTVTLGGRTSGDRVEVSEVAQWLHEMDQLPTVRADKVAAAKAAIANGSLDSDEKLAIALSRMIDEVA